MRLSHAKKNFGYIPEGQEIMRNKVTEILPKTVTIFLFIFKCIKNDFREHKKDIPSAREEVTQKSICIEKITFQS